MDRYTGTTIGPSLRPMHLHQKRLETWPRHTSRQHENETLHTRMETPDRLLPSVLLSAPDSPHLEILQNPQNPILHRRSVVARNHLDSRHHLGQHRSTSIPHPSRDTSPSSIVLLGPILGYERDQKSSAGGGSSGGKDRRH